MSAKEIEAGRIRILETPEFSNRLVEILADRTIHTNTLEIPTFTTMEMGMIGYYIGMCDKDGLYRYLKELIGKDIEAIIHKMET